MLGKDFSIQDLQKKYNAIILDLGANCSCKMNIEGENLPHVLGCLLYTSIIKAIFYQYEIPVFIDEKKDLSQNIFIQYVLSILAIFSKSWSQEAVFASLKTGFYPLESEEIFNLENYCIKWGIKGKKWYEKDWDFGEESEKKEYWNTLRRKIVEPLIAFKSELNRAKTVREITVKLY